MHLVRKRVWKPRFEGEFPTLGWGLIKQIQQDLVVPTSVEQCQPVKLYKEQKRFILNTYRLKEDAEPESGLDAFVYHGALLIRSQKWGKDPVLAFLMHMHGYGPVEFKDWDKDGRPIGVSHGAPNIQCIATVKEQALNTWTPFMSSAVKINEWEGYDIGATRALYPSGKAQWMTGVANSRLGAPITFAAFTEPHLFTEENGLLDTFNTMRRNLVGMGGRWVGASNAWDPLELSAAQQVYEYAPETVYVDFREPRTSVNLKTIKDAHGRRQLVEPEQVREELLYQYGDSAREKGGHVSLNGIMNTLADPSMSEGEKRRYFLCEHSSGDSTPVDANAWISHTTDQVIQPGARVGLGFDGSKSGDCTALLAYDVDTKIINIVAFWEKPHNNKEWSVPRREVDEAVREAFKTYRVGALFGDPYYWEEHLDTWAEDFGRVYEFRTNEEKRMHHAIVRFQHLLETDELWHSGQEPLTRHIANTVERKGKRMPELTEEGRAQYYKKIGKRRKGHYIDIFVAAILAVSAGGYAKEKNTFPDPPMQPYIFVLN